MEAHWEEWCAYAKRAGILNEDGVAIDRQAAQTSFNGFAAGWNSRAMVEKQLSEWDAARYRWLRDGHRKGNLRKTSRPSDAPYVINPKRSVLYGVVAYSGGDLDAAIDEDRINDLAQHIYEEAQIEGDARFADPAFRFSDEFSEECEAKARAIIENEHCQ